MSSFKPKSDNEKSCEHCGKSRPEHLFYVVCPNVEKLK